ncbi:zinc-binding alcohol dehydrogenase family protein [Shumkonia mesophila]|uniref:zinc-binding alcohol dehydrogenase family protein n=1 Tax=Shumkonia mesophila TaxID=2838854 RepID=UPI002934F588|nr:zinc-binding alcohol dehydrogenase family protein [Shumkonia mesophila]
MTTIIVEAPNRLELRDVAPVPPKAGEVQIKVRRAGICGSDIHIVHGSNPFAKYPRVIGHEFAGEISALGDGVVGLEIGDRVVADPVIACGHCALCKAGRPNVCTNLQVIGVHHDGGFRDFATVPAANAIKVPADMPFEIAALAEPFSVGANILSRTGCSAEDSVLIFGAGTAGLTVLQIAKLHGARCLVSDPDEARRERATFLGADVTIDPGAETLEGVATAKTGGFGPSVVIDAAGVPALLDQACHVVGSGGRIGLLGFSGAPSNLDQREVNRKELAVFGSRLNRRLIPQVVQWLQDELLQPLEMISHVFSSKEARTAFDLIQNAPQSTLKVQLTFNS